MKKWEYLTVTVPQFNSQIDFNKLGDEGWELVSTFYHRASHSFDSDRVTAYFKRELKEKELLTEDSSKQVL